MKIINYFVNFDNNNIIQNKDILELYHEDISFAIPALKN